MAAAWWRARRTWPNTACCAPSTSWPRRRAAWWLRRSARWRRKWTAGAPHRRCFSILPNRKVVVLVVNRPEYEVPLGDFSATPRLLVITAFAILIGVVSAYVALALTQLIAFFTNLFFFQRLSASPVSPADHQLGLWVIVVPVIGALIIGLLARYGSERIRGHGIPEAIEAILINGSRVQPRVAVLKPLSSAISIGSGGPFG